MNISYDVLVTWNWDGQLVSVLKSIYLDGWREKDTRAAMVFGRCFEKALGAYFEQQDCTEALFKEWETFRDAPFEYRKGESWDRLLHQGIHLLEKFVREERAAVQHPRENSQLKLTRHLTGGNEFVSSSFGSVP